MFNFTDNLENHLLVALASVEIVVAFGILAMAVANLVVERFLGMVHFAMAAAFLVELAAKAVDSLAFASVALEAEE